MGYSQEHKARSKERILQMAAERFREEGLALSIADLMKAAGLTHGGFYNHFQTRDELVAQALERAIADSDERFTAQGEKVGSLAGFVRSYVSRAHRDLAAQGCAMAALAGEAARADEGTRGVFTRGFRRMLDRVRAMIGGASKDADERAMLAISAAVGAVTLSRAVNDPALSDAILARTRRALLALDADD
jgi:TetR/AcrR family transcriptional repressor of nem operon